MIISVINQKGGVGKSSTSVHFAEWIRKSGLSVIVIDTDMQKSSSTWSNYLNIPNVSIIDPDDLAEQLHEGLVDGYDHAIIDGVGGLSDSTRVILHYADVALIPCQPSGLDLASSNSAIKLVRQAQRLRSHIVGATFLNRVVARTLLEEESRIALNAIKGIPHLNTVIHQRQCVADAFGQEQTVFSSKAGSASATEYTNLFKEVMALCNSPLKNLH